jgi:hypothetical protein
VLTIVAGPFHDSPPKISSFRNARNLKESHHARHEIPAQID